MGGSNAVGVWGYVEGFREIYEQYREAAAVSAAPSQGNGVPIGEMDILASAPSDIVVASGSGGS